MAGSGPLALAFSAQLREYGANIVEVAEAAPRPKAIDFVQLALHGDPSVLMDAVRYRARLMLDRVRFSYSTIIVRVEGRREVERAVVAKVDRDWRVIPGTERSIEVDTVLLGYGLESNSELSAAPRLRADIRPQSRRLAAVARCTHAHVGAWHLSPLATAAEWVARAARCSRAASLALRRQPNWARQRGRGHGAPCRADAAARAHRPLRPDAQPDLCCRARPLRARDGRHAGLPLRGTDAVATSTWWSPPAPPTSISSVP